nr:hypothetical protein [uncultured Rhodopila sp.]
MVTLYEQQKIHREWLKAAGGDLRAVETAIIEATAKARAERRSATSSDVLAAIGRSGARQPAESAAH